MQKCLKSRWLLIYLFALTGFFILLQVSFFIQSNSLYLGAYHFVSYHLKIPSRIFPGIAYFLFMQLVIHVIYVFFIAFIAVSIGKLFRQTQLQIEKTGVLLWITGIFIILFANQYFYPHSKFSQLMETFFSPLTANFFLVGLVILFAIALILACLAHYRLLIMSFLIILPFFIFKHFHANSDESAATASKPNIIIIGVDALRPDFLGFWSGENNTPHLDEFFNHATVFSEALTPLARTYPAWISVLTGEYPKKNGVRLDLAENINFDLHETLPAIFKRAGYQTIYATDETRFSNIDTRFGFDQTITPPIGFNDFLLGSLNDFPLSNLLVNTFLGKYLFPYSYANRAAYITYYPNTFLNFMQPFLANAHSKPLFLTVHFCLSHFPYLWAGKSTDNTSLQYYQEALHEVDLQVYGLLKQLKENKLLKHSVVILLSDHGEAFELSGDRITEPDLFISKLNKKIPHFYPPSVFQEKVNQSGGHGTDVLGLTQYHIVLAFQLTGIAKQYVRAIPGRVSLLDIKPTLLNLLNLPNQSLDGKSLLPVILSQTATIPTQSDFFIETDFTPEAIRTVNPETRKILFEGIDYIQINPITTRLSIRPSMVHLILSSKQYADFYGSWVLALYPQNKEWMMPVLVNLESGYWTTDFNTAFAKQAPVQHMLQALKNFYGHDITHSHPNQ